MKIIVKLLKGGEFSLEVSPTTTVSEIKQRVAVKLGIPTEEQKLLLSGRALVDDQSIQCYPLIKDGSKLNLVVKKPEGLLEASAKYFKSLGLNEIQALSAGRKVLKSLEAKIYKMSWDDLERLCYDILMEESGQCRPPAQQAVDLEPDCEDSFNL